MKNSKKFKEFKVFNSDGSVINYTQESFEKSVGDEFLSVLLRDDGNPEIICTKRYVFKCHIMDGSVDHIVKIPNVSDL